jgi:ParB family transcriptional regulator, chromosome partitioning protein
MDSKASDAQNGFKKMTPGEAFNYRTVSLTDVKADDDAFRITTRTGIEDLIGSIDKMGLLHPPVLVGNLSEYKIVCGFRRIAACRNLGWSQTTARVLTETADRFLLTLLAIADNALQRSLNLMETSRALNLLADVCPDHKRFREAASALGLPVNPSVVAKIKKICRLPLEIQKGIVADTIGLSMALALGELDQPAGEALLAMFDQLKVGLNTQRELLLLVKEIARREGRSVQQLIAEKSLQEILINAQLDRAVKRQKIRFFLQQRRYPSISKAADQYQKRVKQLKLGNEINLIPPKNFENNTFTMILRFKTREDLSDLKEKIEKIIMHPALTEILDR